MIGRKATNPGDPTGDDLSSGTAVGAPNEDDEGRPPGPLRRWWASLSGSASPDEAAPPADDLDLKPTAMRRPEPLYGYVVAVELIFVSILNLTVTHGKGAPTHPPTTLAALGLVVSIALIPIIRITNHRLIVAFSSVIAAFFATLPRVPNSLTTTHLLALIIPVVYAFVLSQRQRKAASARTAAGRSGSGAAAAARSSQARSGDSGGRGRGRRKKDTTSGPQASRRYTPPKAKRAPR